MAGRPLIISSDERQTSDGNGWENSSTAGKLQIESLKMLWQGNVNGSLRRTYVQEHYP